MNRDYIVREQEYKDKNYTIWAIMNTDDEDDLEPDYYEIYETNNNFQSCFNEGDPLYSLPTIKEVENYIEYE